MEKLWLKNYQDGVPEEANILQYESLVELVEQSCRKYAEKPAYSCMGKTMSFSEVDRASRNFGAYLLSELKLQKGDRVAIMMPNLLQYPVVLLGILRAGLTVVNVNPLYTARELEHQLKDSGAKVIVIVENFASTLAKVINRTPVKHVVTTTLGELLGFPKSMIVNLVVKHVKKMVPEFSLPQAVSLSSTLQRGESLEFPQHAVTRDDIAFLQYTGGTTGGFQRSHVDPSQHGFQRASGLHLDPQLYQRRGRMHRHGASALPYFLPNGELPNVYESRRA